MAQSTQGHTVTIKILLSDLGDPLRYEIDQVTLAEGKMPESDETAAQPHFDCLQCRSRYFISPTIVKMAKHVVEVKEEPEFNLPDDNFEKIKEEDFDDKDVVELELYSYEAMVDNSELSENENETLTQIEQESNTSEEVRVKSDLNKHLRSMYQREFRKCENCNKSIKCTKEEFLLHLRREHPKFVYKNFRPEVDDYNGVDFPCIYCEPEIAFTSFDQLKEHLKVTHERDFLCTSCPRAYNRHSHMKRHLKFFHDIDALGVRSGYSCDFNGVDFPCIYCDIHTVYTSFDRLKSHLINRHKRINVCRRCPKAFARRSDLQRHLKTVHKTNEDDIELNDRQEPMEISSKNEENRQEVNEKFNSGSSLKPVIPLVRIDPVIKMIDHQRKKNAVDKSDRPFICDICNACFRWKYYLSVHMNIHLKLKFFCSECPKSYSSINNLKQHKKVAHEGMPAKPLFKCAICPATFKKKCNLIHHLDVGHLGKRYYCDKCTKTYNSERTLTIHKRKVHHNSKFHSCVVCNWSKTCTDAKYHSHLQRVHPKFRFKGPVKVEDFNGVDYPCVYCDPNSIFTSFEALKDHLSCIHDLKYVCKICPNGRGEAKALRHHVKTVHLKKVNLTS